METLLKYVKENPDFKNNYDITEESVKSLFADKPDAEYIDSILSTAEEMSKAVDYDTIDDVMKRKEDDDIFDSTLDYKQEDFNNDHKDDDSLSTSLYSNFKNDNMFNTPLHNLSSVQLLALNIAANCLAKSERTTKPIISNWVKTGNNQSANNTVNSVLEPLSSKSTTKTGKLKYNTFQKLYTDNNPELLRRLKKEVADNYDYRSTMYNKNTVGGQNTLLDKSWLENFPKDVSLDHMNLFCSLNVRDMDKINDME